MMLSNNEFITMSLDLNLFFLRIMKEHSFFLEIGFTPKNGQLAERASKFKDDFEVLLSEATELACGNVSRPAVESQQFVTPYTLDAEKLTSFYTGLPFNFNLTKRELELESSRRHPTSCEKEVESLNHRAFKLTADLASFKERLLHDVLCCKLFTFNYPLLIEHILREARFFMAMLSCLCERRPFTTPQELLNQEAFWNRQMAEHAKFIAGLLDPSEEALIDSARMFGREFDELTALSQKANRRTMEVAGLTDTTIDAMERLQDFKTAGTEGLLECNIRSIIVPLLADHVLREANHYLCVLGVCDNNNNNNCRG